MLGNFRSLVLIHKVLSIKTHPLYGILASQYIVILALAWRHSLNTLYDVLQHSDKQELMVKKYVLAQWRRFEVQAFDNFINISISPCSHWENYRDQFLWVIINSPTLLDLSFTVLFCKHVSVIIAIFMHACIWVFWIDAMV